MVLTKVHILQTDRNPELILDPEGIITIKGRYLVLNPTDIPVQIVSWIDAYLRNPAESTEVIIALEYLSSIGTKNLMSILKELVKSY